MGDKNEKTGIEAARETAAKLKAETEAKEAAQEEAKKAVKSELEKVSSNSELAALYAQNAKVGTENIGGSFPYLKVQTTGKSKNYLADGTKPNDGWFFYSPTKEQIQFPKVHITTISRGFRAPGIPDKQGNIKIGFNQIMGGILIDGDDYRPFVMFVTGGKLSNMWKFGKDISAYTHQKPVGIPMFALTVNLATRNVVDSFGENWVIDFNLELNEDKSPKLITDAGRFIFVRDMAKGIEEMVQALISAKEVKQDGTITGEAVAEARPQIEGRRNDPDPEDYV